MKIYVPYPEEGKFKEPQSWQAMQDVVEQSLPVITRLADKAFYQRDYSSWEKLQQLLFYWNSEIFNARKEQACFTASVKAVLRNVILKTQYEALAHDSPIELQCRDTFTTRAAVEEIYAVASNHRMNSHPFLKMMAEDGLSREMARLFIENWNTDSQIFHLYIAMQSLNTPFELRGELYHNLHEELGEGKIENAHPVIYERNYRTMPRSRVIEPLTESLHMFNTQVYYTSLSGNFRKGLGGLGFIELNVPVQMQMIYDGLRKSGFPDKDLIFWPLHIALDSEHGEAWFDEMAKVIQTADDAQAALEGGVRVLDARASMFDALWREYNVRKAA